MTSVTSQARTAAGTLRARLGAGGIVCVAALTVIFVAVFWPTVLAPGDPLAIHPTEAFLSPRVGHVFGTDESGRDIYTRVVHGAAASAGEEIEVDGSAPMSAAKALWLAKIEGLTLVRSPRVRSGYAFVYVTANGRYYGALPPS